MKTDLSQYPRIILGYHGCDRSVADKVFQEGSQLEVSRNSYDWLGEGRYFWEYGPQRALEWAEKNSKIKHPAVVGAVIHLGDCFDLLDRDATDVLKDLYPLFQQEFPIRAKNKKVHEDDDDFLLRELDCAVINWSLARLEKYGDHTTRYQSVRGLFQESAPIFEGSGVRQRSHIQVAVRDSACILKYFEPELRHGKRA